MSMSLAGLRADTVGTEWQEERMDVISAAGSRTSLSLSHAWSKNRPLHPSTWTLKKPDWQIFRSSPWQWNLSRKWKDGASPRPASALVWLQWALNTADHNMDKMGWEVTVGDSSEWWLVTFHSGSQGQESSKCDTTKRNEATLLLGASCPGPYPPIQRYSGSAGGD